MGHLKPAKTSLRDASEPLNFVRQYGHLKKTSFLVVKAPNRNLNIGSNTKLIRGEIINRGMGI